MRLLVYFCLALLLLFLGLMVLVATPAGLHAGVWVAQRLAPGELSIREAEGRLLDTMRFARLEYRTAETAVDIQGFALDWQPGTLLQGQLHIRALTAEHIDIRLPPADPESELAIPDIRLPLAIHVGQLAVDRLQVTSSDATQTYESVHICGYAEGESLVLSRFNLAGHIQDTDFRLQAYGRVQLTRPWQHNIETEFTLSLPGQPVVEGRATSHGDNQDLHVEASSSAPLKSRLTLNASNLLQTPDWQAMVNIDEADLSPWLESATRLSADLRASGTGTSLQGQLALNLSGDIQQQLNLSTDAVVAQEKQTLQFNKLALDSPTHSLKLDLKGSLNYGAPLKADLEGGWSLAQPQTMHGNLAFYGNPDDYRIQLSALTEQPYTIDARLNAHGDTASLTIEQLDASLLQGKLQADGHINWQDTPAISLQGNWQNLMIPGTELDLRSPRGDLRVEGTINDYQLSSSGLLRGQRLPKIDWQASASGNQQGLQLQKLKLLTLEGSITGSGDIDWTDAIRGQAAVNLQGINPGHHWPDWPGKLHGQTRLTLTTRGKDWQSSIKNLQINGKLRGYPLEMKGDAQVAKDQYQLDKLRVAIAESWLSVNGRLGDNSDLGWQFRSPDVGQLLPDATGTLQAEGTLTGNVRQPQLSATASASQLQTPWLSLAQLKADVQIQAARDAFKADINADRMQFDGRDIERLSFQANGRLSRHDLQTTIEADKRHLELAGNGSWQNGSWSLQLNNGDYSGPIAGNWRLQSPLQLTVSQDRLQAPEHCWQHESAELCLAGGWQAAQDWHGRVSLRNYLLAQATAADSELPSLKGRLNGKLEVRGNDQLLKDARGQIKLTDLTLQPDQETELRISELSADLASHQQGMTLNIDGQFAEPAPGKLSGRLETGVLRFAEWTTTPLQGEVSANISDLKPWLALYPRFTTEQASLQSDFTVDGQLGNPKLDGNMSVAASEVGIPELGITMETLEFNISGQPQSGLQLSANAKSGPGELTAKGRVSLENGALQMPSLSVEGERFELLNLPEAWVLASPDLQLSYSDNLLKVDGKVTIPEALLQPLDTPATIPVSEDEYIVNKERDKAPTPPWQVRANVTLVLGDEVRITGGGFEGRLAGKLDIKQNPGQSASAVGELRVVDGEYSAYGQQLSIDTGEIIFTGQPIDNPALNARAVRKVDGVTAGIRVTGTAQQPVTELFSSPTMPEADILSYLTLGRPLDKASAGDSDMLLKAATSMGIKRTESIRQKIASTLGVDTLAVDTGTTTAGEADTRLVIGKYLSPNLYISYGAGLVETAVDAVKLRYEINRHLSLEATQGAGTGVDLLYQIESGSWWD